MRQPRVCHPRTPVQRDLLERIHVRKQLWRAICNAGVTGEIGLQLRQSNNVFGRSIGRIAAIHENQ